MPTVVPEQHRVEPGQVRWLRSDLWSSLKLKWPMGTTCLVLFTGTDSYMQFSNDPMDLLMPDGTVEPLRVSWVL